MIDGYSSGTGPYLVFNLKSIPIFSVFGAYHLFYFALPIAILLYGLYSAVKRQKLKLFFVHSVIYSFFYFVGIMMSPHIDPSYYSSLMQLGIISSIFVGFDNFLAFPKKSYRIIIVLIILMVSFTFEFQAIMKNKQLLGKRSSRSCSANMRMLENALEMYFSDTTIENFVEGPVLKYPLQKEGYIQRDPMCPRSIKTESYLIKKNKNLKEFGKNWFVTCEVHPSGTGDDVERRSKSIKSANSFFYKMSAVWVIVILISISGFLWILRDHVGNSSME
ncbi:hypothetical protein KAJ27_11725 [bacterium]|nr:hypothetical protein [bacterium]